MRRVVWLVALLWARGAAADPVFSTPVIGKKARWGGGDRDPALLGLTVDARILGVVDASRLAAWPDREQGIEVREPQLAAGVIGVVAHLRCVPLSFVARADAAEPTRPWIDGPAGARVSAVVDDAYMLWRPAQAANLVIGRARVPFTKTRQHDEMDEPLGAPPFVVDRIAPDRRTGVLFHGDLGAMAYAAGAYEDLDVLEPRIRVGDPSENGLFAATAHLEWTPRAPMYGSNPPGKIAGAAGPLPTPRTDPWHETFRPSLGLGSLVRVRDDDTTRLDVSFSLHVKWRFIALLAEGIGTIDDGDTSAATHGSLMLTPIDPLALTARAEYDSAPGADGEWTAGGGLTWHVTKDRRNKVAFVGWYRRDLSRNTAYDGAAVYLQASL